ncbi:MAG: sodium ion-translocating decarboxylase subunit beta, partial [Clostridia bacterium]|nr:sodium ion-translocating decarboxylase subunit beta [Clostridia bacterium]
MFEKSDSWKSLVMYLIVFVLFYLAVVKKFEPLLLLPIAFGMLLANLPGAELMHLDFFFDDYYLDKYPIEAFADMYSNGHIKMTEIIKEVINEGGLLDIIYLGVKLGIYPSLIFLGIGAMTDFSPLIANPISLLMG